MTFKLLYHWQLTLVYQRQVAPWANRIPQNYRTYTNSTTVAVQIMTHAILQIRTHIVLELLANYVHRPTATSHRHTYYNKGSGTVGQWECILPASSLTNKAHYCCPPVVTLVLFDSTTFCGKYPAYTTELSLLAGLSKVAHTHTQAYINDISHTHTHWCINDSSHPEVCVN